MKKTVLITGANGLIGSILCHTLANNYTLRSFSLHSTPGVDSVVGDISDLDALLTACVGVDIIIHLAAMASIHASWEVILPTNIIGTYNVFEAARQTGVQQIIFASTNHTVGKYDLENDPAIYLTGQPLLNHLVPVRPDSLYGVSKCFGETLGRHFADQHGLRTICLRIGCINPQNSPPIELAAKRLWGESAERLAAIWISHRDLIQLIEKCLLAEHINFDIFYGISNNLPHYYDLEHARELLGYAPQDGALVEASWKKEPSDNIA